MKKYFWISITLVLLGACKSSDNKVINLRLLWYPQAQFSGYIVAKDKGFYEEQGIKVEIKNAGPDLNPITTVASGLDQIGVGIPNRIIEAKNNEVPLIAIAQIFQDSPNRYVIKKKNAIDTLTDLRNKKIGLWLGGDEAEFFAMLHHCGMSENDVQIISQGYSVIPFLHNEYICSQVTVYNELILLENEGYPIDSLQILSPKDYNSAILGDMLFCKKEFAESNKEILKKFLIASFKGWKYCIENQEEAVDIILKYNKELDKDTQLKQLKAIEKLIKTGDNINHGLGYINKDDYLRTEDILFSTGQIDKRVDVEEIIDLTYWSSVPDSVKALW